jgi:hypothetical protein
MSILMEPSSSCTFLSHYSSSSSADNTSRDPNPPTVVRCTWDFVNVDHRPVDDTMTIYGPDGYIQFTAMSPSLPVRIVTYGTTNPSTTTTTTRTATTRDYTFTPPEHTGGAMIEAITNELIVVLGREDDNDNNDTSSETKEREQDTTIPTTAGTTTTPASSTDYISRGENAVRTSVVLDTVLKKYYGTRGIGFWDTRQGGGGKTMQHNQEPKQEKSTILVDCKK